MQEKELEALKVEEFVKEAERLLEQAVIKQSEVQQLEAKAESILSAKTETPIFFKRLL